MIKGVNLQTHEVYWIWKWRPLEKQWLATLITVKTWRNKIFFRGDYQLERVTFCFSARIYTVFFYVFKYLGTTHFHTCLFETLCSSCCVVSMAPTLVIKWHECFWYYYWLFVTYWLMKTYKNCTCITIHMNVFHFLCN